MKKRLAVVLMNLGGPDTLSAIRPFLRNLFSDPEIIELSWPFRYFFALLISWIRVAKVKKIYQKLGGGSPLLSNTQAQQAELFKVLSTQLPEQEIEVFIAMRYWHPFTQKTVSQVKAFQPDEVVLLPLYPQFSKTTTGSSFKEWRKKAQNQGLHVPMFEIHSYPQNESFVEAHVSLLMPWIEKAAVHGPPRLLFSAHGLPQRVIEGGDPYEAHVHQTVQAICEKLPQNLESVVCYQSKVGPLKWLSPSTQDELKKAGKDKVPVIVIPVAFVSEHCETLVELDEDYRYFAQEQGVPFYGRVPALGTHPAYMEALAGLVVGKGQDNV